jgi:hypothetical protein
MEDKVVVIDGVEYVLYTDYSDDIKISEESGYNEGYQQGYDEGYTDGVEQRD